MSGLTVSLDQQMTEEEYLRGDFESDVDFVDDHIEERCVGEYEHSNWQGALLAWFRQDNGFRRLYALPELRVKVASRRYRVPDVTLLTAPLEGRIVTLAPLAVFEILSPEDRHSRLKERFRDYEKMGVRNMFLVEGLGEYLQFRAGRFSTILGSRTDLEGSDGFVDWEKVAGLLY